MLALTTLAKSHSHAQISLERKARQTLMYRAEQDMTEALEEVNGRCMPHPALMERTGPISHGDARTIHLDDAADARASLFKARESVTRAMEYISEATRQCAPTQEDVAQKDRLPPPPPPESIFMPCVLSCHTAPRHATQADFSPIQAAVLP